MVGFSALQQLFFAQDFYCTFSHIPWDQNCEISLGKTHLHNVSSTLHGFSLSRILTSQVLSSLSSFPNTHKEILFVVTILSNFSLVVLKECIFRCMAKTITIFKVIVLQLKLIFKKLNVREMKLNKKEQSILSIEILWNKLQ